MSINPLNEKFDPNSHKALFEQVTSFIVKIKKELSIMLFSFLGC